MMLGDMFVVGAEKAPAKLLKALAVIASDLHPTFDRERWGIVPDWSKHSCILCSLTVRDFFWKIGFKDAALAPVYFAVHAYRGKELVHSLGVGDHAAMGIKNPPPNTATNWSGHAAVRVDGWLVDTTLYQCQRPQWEGLPGMMAAPLQPKDWMPPLYGHTAISGGAAQAPNGDMIEMVWLDQPHNKHWRDDPADAEKSRRANVVKQLVAKFGAWKQ